MTNHPTRQDWDDNRIVLVEEGDDYTAYSSPEANGEVYVDEDCISVDSANGLPLDQHGAPFKFDIVFHERYPREGEVEPLAEELGERFANQFDSKVDEVYNLLEGSDDPLDTIMALEPDDLTVGPAQEE